MRLQICLLGLPKQLDLEKRVIQFVYSCFTFRRQISSIHGSWSHKWGEKAKGSLLYIPLVSNPILLYHLPFHLLSFDLFRADPPHFMLINGILLLSLEK